MKANGRLYISFDWECLKQQENPVDYTVFIQVLDSRNKVVAQADAKPVNGLVPTSSWSQGMLIHDKYALTLPAQLEAGHYRIIAGMYNPANGQRLPALAQGQRLQDDAMPLTEFDLGAGR